MKPSEGGTPGTGTSRRAADRTILEVSGEWWTPETPEQRVHGRARCADPKGRLELQPTVARSDQSRTRLACSALRDWDPDAPDQLGYD